MTHPTTNITHLIVYGGIALVIYGVVVWVQALVARRNRKGSK